ISAASILCDVAPILGQHRGNTHNGYLRYISCWSYEKAQARGNLPVLVSHVSRTHPPFIQFGGCSFECRSTTQKRLMNSFWPQALSTAHFWKTHHAPILSQ